MHISNLVNNNVTLAFPTLDKINVTFNIEYSLSINIE